MYRSIGNSARESSDLPIRAFRQVLLKFEHRDLYKTPSPRTLSKSRRQVVSLRSYLLENFRLVVEAVDFTKSGSSATTIALDQMNKS